MAIPERFIETLAGMRDMEINPDPNQIPIMTEVQNIDKDLSTRFLVIYDKFVNSQLSKDDFINQGTEMVEAVTVSSMAKTVIVSVLMSLKV